MRAMRGFFMLAVFLAAGGTASAKDLFYTMGNSLIQVIDGDTDEIVGEIPVDGWIRESQFTADKKYLWVTAKRHLLHKIDLQKNRVVQTLDLRSGGWERFAFGFALAADGKTAYVHVLSRKTDGGEVVIGTPVLAQVDLATGKFLRTLEVPWGVAHLVAVKGADMIYAVGKDLYQIDTTGADMRIAGTYPLYEKQMNFLPFWDYAWENGGISMANYYTPDHMGLLSVDTRTGVITDTPIQGIPVFAYSAIYSPDKKKAYAVMDELNVINLETDTYEAVVPIHQGTCYGGNVSSDGKKIYAGPAGPTVTVFDAATLEPIKVISLKTDGMDIRRLTR